MSPSAHTSNAHYNETSYEQKIMDAVITGIKAHQSTVKPYKAARGLETFYFIVLNSPFMPVVTLFYVPLPRILIAIDCESSTQQHSGSRSLSLFIQGEGAAAPDKSYVCSFSYIKKKKKIITFV